MPGLLLPTSTAARRTRASLLSRSIDKPVECIRCADQPVSKRRQLFYNATILKSVDGAQLDDANERLQITPPSVLPRLPSIQQILLGVHRQLRRIPMWFLLKLNAAGAGTIYTSTYLGGARVDYAGKRTLDSRIVSMSRASLAATGFRQPPGISNQP